MTGQLKACHFLYVQTTNVIIVLLTCNTSEFIFRDVHGSDKRGLGRLTSFFPVPVVISDNVLTYLQDDNGIYCQCIPCIMKSAGEGTCIHTYV